MAGHDSVVLIAGDSHRQRRALCLRARALRAEQLAVWWLAARLGIHLERIAPGHLEQNGRHDRMHLTEDGSGPGPPRRMSSSSRRASIGSFSLTIGAPS